MIEKAYRTIVADAVIETELSQKQSRFICCLYHVESTQDALLCLEAQRKRYHDARHHVSAWILQTGEEKANDDGEPSHSSGAPTLSALHAAQLCNVAAITTRYFGGTLLGVGGLVRAYGDVCKQTIAQAQTEQLIVTMHPVLRYTFIAPFSLSGAAEQFLAKLRLPRNKDSVPWVLEISRDYGATEGTIFSCKVDVSAAQDFEKLFKCEFYQLKLIKGDVDYIACRAQ